MRNCECHGNDNCAASFHSRCDSYDGQTICYTTVPTTQIGSTTAASGGDNSITYQWQYSTDNTFATGVTTVASNTATYTPTQTLTQTTYYRRQAKDNTCNTTFTNSAGVWAVIVRPQFTTGEIATTGQTILQYRTINLDRKYNSCKWWRWYNNLSMAV